MRLRRPPFALLLVAILGLIAIAVLLAYGGGVKHVGTPSISGPQPTRACVTAHAQAQAVARGTAAGTATATAPVTVTERATGPKGSVAVTRSATLVERARTHAVLTVGQSATKAARACATGAGARSSALQRAYALALARARATARTHAHRALQRLVRRVAPVELARAHQEASLRARSAAAALRRSLERAAHRQAVARTAG